MTHDQTPQSFGEQIPAGRLSAMARNIVRGIDGGQVTPYAGFLWYRPQGLFQQNLHHAYVERARSVRRAA